MESLFFLSIIHFKWRKITLCSFEWTGNNYFKFSFWYRKQIFLFLITISSLQKYLFTVTDSILTNNWIIIPLTRWESKETDALEKSLIFFHYSMWLLSLSVFVLINMTIGNSNLYLGDICSKFDSFRSGMISFRI
jgi:hypothetical protein